MKREVMELRRIGLEVKDMGERKLKGLEGGFKFLHFRLFIADRS